MESLRKLFARLDEMTEPNGRNAWESAKIVKEIWESKEHHDESGSFEVARERLQAYSGRFTLLVSDMIEMIKAFPNLKDWESGRLDIIRDKTAIMLEEKRRQNRKPSKQATPKPTKSDPAANVAESATIRKQVEAELKRDFKQKARQEAERETKQALAQIEHRNKQAIAKIESEKTETIASLRDDLAELRRKIAQEKRKSAKLEGQVNILKQALLDSGIDPDALLAGNAPSSPRKSTKRSTRTATKQPPTAKRATRSTTKPKAAATRKKAGPKAKRKP